MRVFFHPHGGPYGVGRYIEGLLKELPRFVDIVNDPRGADVYHCNVWRPEGIPRVDVYTFHSSAVERNPNLRWQLGLMREAKPRFLVVPSRWQGNRLKRIANGWNIPLPEVVPIHHGVQFEKIPPGLIGVPGSYILWGKSHLGRVGDNDILAEVASRFPDSHFFTTLWREGLSKPHNIRVIGKRSHQRMLQIMGYCEFMIFTWPESGGIQALEAMALGKPVLSVAEGGIAEAIEHKKSGYLWTNLDDLCRGIEFCRANWKRISVAAVERAKEFTWERSARKHFELYQRCLT